MATIGKLGEFDERLESFTAWYTRFKYFIEANSITENSKKTAILVSSLGPKSFGILMDILVPETPESKSFDELVDTLMKYYKPKKIITAERFKFYSTNQKETEDILQFSTKLKHLASTCKFGTFLQEAMRDRLICGLRNTAIQQKLIEADVPYEETLQKALMLEQISKETKELSINTGNCKAEVFSHKSVKVEPTVSRTPKPHQVKHNVQQQPLVTKDTCYRCGKAHDPRTCPYKNFKCNKCGKIGHLGKACKTKKRILSLQNEADTKTSEPESGMQNTTNHVQLWRVETVRAGNQAYQTELLIEGQKVLMTIDCGAAVSIIPEELYRQKFSSIPVSKANITLEVYGGAQLPLLGKIDVQVQHNKQKKKLPLFVAKDLTVKAPVLLGREWMEQLCINWSSVQHSEILNITENKDEYIIKLKNEFPQVFTNQTGCIDGFEARLLLKDEARPVFCKARTVPLALKEKVKTEIDTLVSKGILEPVRHSEWATPIVIVPKANNQVRLCGDFKVTINPQLRTEHYPLPTVEDIFTSVSDGKVFAVLDLSTAYLQLKMADDSADLLTVNTPYGLYKFNRLCYGVSAAPMIFQSVMDRVLQGLTGTMCYIDDILVSGSSMSDCMNKLRSVCNRLQRHNITLNESKCQLFTNQVEYLGHLIDAKGIHPLPDKTCAIRAASPPENLTELKAYLGLVNYYAKFIPNLSSILHPLYKLTQKNAEWIWSKECQEAFEQTKNSLTDQSLLMPYNSTLPLRLNCDASSVGLGAILSHVLENGEERPILFASKALSEAERKYSNIEREALAIIFGVRKFHKYLYGRTFELVTDHKPLLTIFHPKKGTSTTTAARLQRWSILLSAYQYTIVYKKGTEIPHVDGLSRFSKQLEENDTIESQIYYFSPARDAPLNSKDVREETEKDSKLSQIYKWVQCGWPNGVSQELRPYFVKREELTTDQGCLLWGSRIVIPEKLKGEVLHMLHEQHLGRTKMKAVARSHFWWPNIDQEVEDIVNHCESCQAMRNANPKQVYEWPPANIPWERIHLDLAKINEQNILILVDAFSKWAEIKLLHSTITTEVIEEVRSIFAAHGLPYTLVSDNGAQFTSSEFGEFLRQNGVKHILIPPRHPASNGQVERTIQTIKTNLKKQVLDDVVNENFRSWQHRLDNFLLAYRTTPHSATGMSPSELLMGRLLRTRLDMLKPEDSRIVRTSSKAEQASGSFEIGQEVHVWNNYGVRRMPVKWVKGKILERLGTVLYKVQLENGQIKCVHVEALRCVHAKSDKV